MQKLNEAEKLWLHLIAALKASPDVDTSDRLAHVYYYLGSLYTKFKLPDKAEQAWKQSLKINRSNVGRTLECEYNLACQLNDQSHPKEAVPFGRDWLNYKFSHDGYSDKDALEKINWFADMAIRAGKINEFEPYYNKLIANLSSRGQPTMDAVLNLSNRLALTGQHAKLVTLLQKQLSSQKNMATAARLIFFVELGESFCGLGKIDEAKANLLKAKALCDSSTDRNFYYRAMHGLGVIDEIQRKSRDAAEIFTGLLEYCRKRFSPAAPESLECMLQLSSIYEYLKDYSRSDSYSDMVLTGASKEAEAAKDVRSKFVFGALTWKMRCSEDRSDYASAVKYAEQLWQICQKSSDLPFYQKLDTLRSYERILRKLGRIKEADRMAARLKAMSYQK